MAAVSVRDLPKSVREDRMKAYGQVFGNVGDGANTGKNYDPRERQSKRK